MEFTQDGRNMKMEMETIVKQAPNCERKKNNITYVSDKKHIDNINRVQLL